MSVSPYSNDSEGMSADMLRKSNKPLLEKKRRARINKSLDQLKGLVLEALKKDSARYSKLEKADILEMTVKHLKEMQRHQMAAAVSVDPSVLPKYRAGFSECAEEVNRYLSSIDGLSSEMRMRLLSHLADCMTHVNVATTPYSPPLGVAYAPHASTPLSALPGFQQQAVHVAYPELLPAEMLARTVLSPLLRSSPELSPCENRGYPEPHAPHTPHHTSAPHGYSPPTCRPPPAIGIPALPKTAERPRVMRPLAELDCNTPKSCAPHFAKLDRPHVKTEPRFQESPRHVMPESHVRARSHVPVPVHMPLHVDVKQETMWRPW